MCLGVLVVGLNATANLLLGEQCEGVLRGGRAPARRRTSPVCGSEAEWRRTLSDAPTVRWDSAEA